MPDPITRKTKPAMPPARALKDVAAVLARHSAKRQPDKADSVSQEVVRGGASHLKAARSKLA